MQLITKYRNKAKHDDQKRQSVSNNKNKQEKEENCECLVEKIIKSDLSNREIANELNTFMAAVILICIFVQNFALVPVLHQFTNMLLYYYFETKSNNLAISSNLQYSSIAVICKSKVLSCSHCLITGT